MVRYFNNEKIINKRSQLYCMASEEGLIYEEKIKGKLAEYAEKDIGFLKREWRSRLANKDYDFFIRKCGAPPQAVYDILKKDKIIKIRPSKDRIEIITDFQKNHFLRVIFLFDEPKKYNLGIITYYKINKNKIQP